VDSSGTLHIGGPHHPHRNRRLFHGIRRLECPVAGRPGRSIP
jgi:hypothetical protein